MISSIVPYDAIIVGAGPAGITASIYLARKKLDILVISKDLGGQAALSSSIENYLGYRLITGPEFVKKFEEHVKAFNIEVKYEEVKAVKPKDGIFLVETNRNNYLANTVIIAAGKIPLHLNVPGEEEFTGRGVSYCAICLPPNSEIIVNNDIKEIKEISKSELVLTHDGTFKPVEEKIEREYSGDLVRITTKFFRENDTLLTPNHPVLATKIKKGKGKNYWNFVWYPPEWVPAGNLTKDYFLLYPIVTDVMDIKSLDISRLGLVKKNGSLSYKKTTHTSHNLPRKIPLNRDFLRLVGYYLSDGSIAKQGLIIYLQANQKSYAKDISKIVKSLFGFKPSVKKNKNVIKVSIYSKLLANLFEKLFCKYSYNKCLPHWMIYLPPYKQKELIKGIWRGDGCKREKDFAITTTSKKLCSQLKILLLRSGIIPSVSRTPISKLKASAIGEREIKFKHDRFEIKVGGPSLEKMSKILGIKHEKIKNRNRIVHHAWIRGNYLYLPIHNISKKKYRGKVYNLAVRANNSYTTTNAILHNCDAPVFKDLPVVVVGGGNSALDAVLQLSKFTKQIYLVNITENLGGDEATREKVKKLSYVKIFNNCRITKIEGKNFVESVEVQNIKTNEKFKLNVKGVFILIGLRPGTDIDLPVKLNEKKEIVVDKDCKTSFPGIFAAGDVTDCTWKQIIIAAGEGAKAALSAYEYLKSKKEFLNGKYF